MLLPMRVPFVLLTSFVLAFHPGPMRAQRFSSDQIAQAFHFWSDGQPKVAIEILDAMLRARVNSGDDREQGAAWNVLGSAYLDLERCVSLQCFDPWVCGHLSCSLPFLLVRAGHRHS